MAMAMMNQLLYGVPTLLKPFARKLVASILDWNIVHYCQLEKLGPSPVLRTTAYDIFRLCGWLIREFGLPRLDAHQRSPKGMKGNTASSPSFRNGHKLTDASRV
jgi:hypothetical protein